MKVYHLFPVFLFSFAVLSCEDEHLTLNINKDQSFEGSFKLKTDNKATNQSGASTLEISGGFYKGYTYDGMALSAGRIKVTASKVTFLDTVHKIFHPQIIPPTYLRGTYDYIFDGNKLQIGNRYSSGWVETHTFHLKK